MFKKLSILIPVYNEEKTIKPLLERLENLTLPYNLEKEIILVDDSSTDNTKNILKEIKKHKIFFHEKNKGKGHSIRTGIKHSTGDMIIIQDADLEYSPEQIPNLIEPIIKGKSKVVYGSRFLNQKLSLFGKNKTMFPLHFIGNTILTYFTNLLYKTNLTDMETCYKLISKEAIDKIELKSKRFDFEPEITAKIIKKGYKIYEIPIEFNPRNWDQGKKITKLDGLKALYYLIKYRFFD